ncbi:MAG: hypothetical protein IV100_24525 [Myxococcales bacterium]|nr:hypothetical protein [Myxococcales bacterium]
MWFFRFRKITPISAILGPAATAPVKPGAAPTFAGALVGSSVIVSGTVSARTEVTFGPSGDKAIWYSATYESQGRGDRGSRNLWMFDHLDRQQGGFFIDDGTGRIYVPVQPTQMDIRGGHHVYGEIGRTGKERYSTYLLRDGDSLRLHGVVDKPSGKEPRDTLVLRAAEGGVLFGLATPRRS